MYDPRDSRPISRGEFTSRLAYLCLKSGLTGFPRKFRDQHILLKSVALTLDKTSNYAEEEIDDKLIFWLSDVARGVELDHVTLRRLLVDEHYLEREKDGSRYRVGVTPAQGAVFERDVEDIDIYVSIGVSMKLIQQRKQEYLGRKQETA